VRAEVVVDVAPVEVEDLGLEDRVEDLAVEELVAEPGVEALDERVLPGAARFDVDGAGPGEPTPVANRAGDQFRPVVHPDALGSAALGLGTVQHLDHIVGGDGAAQPAADAFAGVLVAHRKRLDRSTVRGRIEYEIECPDLVPALCPKPLDGYRARPHPMSLHRVRPHPQTFLAPQPLHPLAIHHPALTSEQGVGEPISEPRPVPRDLAQPET